MGVSRLIRNALEQAWTSRRMGHKASEPRNYASSDYLKQCRERAPGRTSIPVLFISFRIAYRYKCIHPDSTIQPFNQPNASQSIGEKHRYSSPSLIGSLFTFGEHNHELDRENPTIHGYIPPNSHAAHQTSLARKRKIWLLHLEGDSYSY